MLNGNSAHSAVNDPGSLRGALPPGWWFCRVTVWRIRP